MPSLTEEEQALLLAYDPNKCPDCGATVNKNYCRQCDQFFFEGHKHDCPRMAPGFYSENHAGHRTY